MRKRIGISFLIMAMGLAPGGPIGEARANEIRVAFLNPASDDRENEYWWNLCTDFMQEAAEDLGINLITRYANRNRSLIIQQAAALMHSPDKPDFIVMQNLKQSALPIIRLAQEHGVKVMLFNSGLSQQELTEAGGPRDKYPNWIGEILPDDRHAGYLQAEILIDHALAMGLKDADGKVQMMATAGVMSDTSAIERDKGLMTFITERKHVVTLNRNQALPCNWRRDMAREVFRVAYREYPETTVVWNANDAQALGVLDEATHTFGKMPGRDLLIAGIDWNPENIEKIKSGEILASIGGHFVEGVWALVLIADYANGIDFASQGLSYKTGMMLLNADNLTRLNNALQQRDRKHIARINYSLFSKARNADLTDYNFYTSVILEQLIDDSE